MRRGPALTVLMAAVVVSCGALYGLQTRLDAYKGETPYVGEFMRLPDAHQLKTASLGYEALVADMLWLKAVQHMGEIKITSEGYDWIYKALDTVTTLDPQFVEPYEAGGLILTIVNKNAELSNKLLIKGYSNNPDVWQLPFYIGFNYFYFFRDYKMAAKYMSLAAAMKGSPKWLPLLASRLYMQSNDPRYALEFLVRMYDSTKDERLREEMIKRINQLKAVVEVDKLQKAVDMYKARTGRVPAGLSDLVAAGLLTGVPPEPNGGYYYIGGDGKVSSSKLDENIGVYMPRGGGK